MPTPKTEILLSQQIRENVIADVYLFPDKKTQEIKIMLTFINYGKIERKVFPLTLLQKHFSISIKSIEERKQFLNGKSLLIKTEISIF